MPQAQSIVMVQGRPSYCKALQQLCGGLFNAPLGSLTHSSNAGCLCYVCCFLEARSKVGALKICTRKCLQYVREQIPSRQPRIKPQTHLYSNSFCLPVRYVGLANGVSGWQCAALKLRGFTNSRSFELWIASLEQCGGSFRARIGAAKRTEVT